jgi:hypothetical protein
MTPDAIPHLLCAIVARCVSTAFSAAIIRRPPSACAPSSGPTGLGMFEDYHDHRDVHGIERHVLS